MSIFSRNVSSGCRRLKQPERQLSLFPMRWSRLSRFVTVLFGLTMGRFGKKAFPNMSMNIIFPPWKRSGLHGKQSIHRKPLNRNPRMQMIRQLCRHFVNQRRCGWEMVQCSLPMQRCWMQMGIPVMRFRQGQQLP
ncbi:unknown [Ruminococcus sp. CAG:254]|nr:unknown [Ruminococcus sp. CAG:254]